jgi:hypothetical protein
MIDNNYFVVYNIVMVHKLSESRKEHQRQYYKRWYKKNGRKRNPNSMIAMGVLNNAVLSGKVVKPNKCNRCNKIKRIYGHHVDYSKPLDVVWLCASCHKIIHQTFKPINEPYIKPKKESPVDKKSIIVYNNEDMSAKYIDLDNLRIAIREMTYQQGLYRVIRDELRSRGNWCNRPRGNPKLGYQVMKAKKEKV